MSKQVAKPKTEQNWPAADRPTASAAADQAGPVARGPLRLPQPPDPAAHRALASLKGHTTSPVWLPEGVWPELDDLRNEQLRLRAQVASDLQALDALAAGFRKEDAEHGERLRQAHRDGNLAAVKDRRTPAAKRASERAAIEERLWAGLQVFAEYAEKVIEVVRAQEDSWLADLRSRMTPAQEKRRRAQELLAEAKAEEFRLHKLGRWVQSTADDEAFGRQPAPEAGPVPDRISAEVLEGGFERPCHQRKPWNGTTKRRAA